MKIRFKPLNTEAQGKARGYFYADPRRQREGSVLVLTFPALDTAICALLKTDKKVSLSLRSAFRHFPVFWNEQIVPKRSNSTLSAKSAVAFLLLTLLWRSKAK